HSVLDKVKLDKVAPTANAGQSQTVSLGSPVALDGSASSDNTGIISYAWDFKDGTTGMGTTVTHLYTDPGTYIVTLTVKDAAGNSDTASTTIIVSIIQQSPS